MSAYVATEHHMARLDDLKAQIGDLVAELKGLESRMRALPRHSPAWEFIDEQARIKMNRLDLLVSAQAAVAGEVWVS